jgi:hypothetical protein
MPCLFIPSFSFRLMIKLALELLRLFWINTLSLKLRKKRKGYVECGKYIARAEMNRFT